MTNRVLKNVIGKIGGPEGIQGFDALDPDDKVHVPSMCLVHHFYSQRTPCHRLAVQHPSVVPSRAHAETRLESALIQSRSVVCATQEVVRSAFERGSVHAPDGEEDEPTPVKVSSV